MSDSEEEFFDAEEVEVAAGSVFAQEESPNVPVEVRQDGDDDDSLCNSTVMAEATLALDLFLSNKFHDAEKICEAKSQYSMYHALGMGTITFLKGVMTFERQDIVTALANLKHCTEMSSRLMKKFGFFGTVAKWVVGTGPGQMRKNDLHASLVYAESLLLKAGLTVAEDERLGALISSAMQTKSSYNTYKQCWALLTAYEAGSALKDHSTLDAHFISGVQQGMGGFNLMLSLLPSKVLTLIGIFGLSGDREVGLQQLYEGHKSGALRAPLCGLILLAYHTIICHHLLLKPDLALAEEILNRSLAKYPEGALFLFFAGRLSYIKGEVEQAVMNYQHSVAVQSEYRQLHHLCYWELSWCNALLLNWSEAASYSRRLVSESKWSVCFYKYQLACFLYMMKDSDPSVMETVVQLMAEVPKAKQKIAGKSIPLEKYVCRKARSFEKQNQRLLLPALELLLVWNMLPFLGPLLPKVLVLIEGSLEELTRMPKYATLADDKCLALLLKGVVLRELVDVNASKAAFEEVIALEKEIKLDHYIAPFNRFEFARLLMEMGDHKTAKYQLGKIKKKYKQYSLENRLTFRLHAANVELGGK